jgi:DivIVA domain-containing protein
MEMSPNQVRTATFASARKGFDPTEVTTFLDRAAEALEAAQNHATAMEARARAAVAKLQELSSGESSRSAPAADPRAAEQAEVEAISRTLLLAQRAADEAIAEAQAEAAQLLEQAREEARNVEAAERDQMRSEVDALVARREFLTSDVEQLENFLLDQRERLRSAASSLIEIAEQVPDGLGYVRPPLLSASDDHADDDSSSDRLVLDEAALVTDDDSETDGDGDGGAETDDGHDDGAGDDEFDATEALPPIIVSDDHDPVANDDATPASSQLRFAPGVEHGTERPDPGRGPGR